MPPKVEMNDNQKIIVSLTDQLADLSKARTRLKFLKKPDDATKVQAKYDELFTKVEELEAKEMNEWGVDAPKILTNLSKTNEAIDDAIEHIKKNVKTGEKVVKLLKQADKVIKIAGEIISKIP